MERKENEGNRNQSSIPAIPASDGSGWQSITCLPSPRFGEGETISFTLPRGTSTGTLRTQAGTNLWRSHPTWLHCGGKMSQHSTKSESANGHRPPTRRRDHCMLTFPVLKWTPIPVA